ncbi:cob(I)yrinic acid a,c-diamide adenosyltransferase [candidate division KSB1 bacterium]|nr:cob(I)yrinic acid a,c-diamide adenosyltransferase [candidate division KSB1 bacterium]
MKIYTGTGDQGMTSLVTGERISKGDLKVESYGTIDELNSWLGVIVSQLPLSLEQTIKELKNIQSNLFVIGSCLATPFNSPLFDLLKKIDLAEIKKLENAIDTYSEQLLELRNFILPGGHPLAAWTHVARTVCRRAERRIINLLELEIPNDTNQTSMTNIQIYINRLADYLFTLARYINFHFGKTDENLQK